MNTFMRSMFRMIARIGAMVDVDTDCNIESAKFDEECAKRAIQVEGEINETVKNMNDDDE